MSLPNRAPIAASRAVPNGAGASASSARSTAAASALPPPNPPPTGIRFSISIANPLGHRAAPAYASAARSARFRSGGPTSAPRQSMRRPPAATRTTTSSPNARRTYHVAISW